MGKTSVAVVAAIGSATGYGVSSVLQQRACEEQTDSHGLQRGLLLRLVSQPIWLAGLGADGVAYVLQFVALGHGSLAVVQPLLVSGLLVALPLSAWLEHCGIKPREWMAALLVVAGLSAFLLAGSPAEGRPDASTGAWIILGACGVVIIGALMLAAGGRPGARRASCLGAAAGVSNGLLAALTKASAHLLGHGIVPLVTHWQPYALVAGAILSIWLSQSAFQAGSLAASLPTLTVVDPLASTAIGALFLGESLNTAGLAPLIQGLGVLAMVAGVFVLGRSPLISCTHRRAPEALASAAANSLGQKR